MKTIKEISAQINETINDITIRYVNDSALSGIKRIKDGDSFNYIFPDGNICEDENILKRIKSLVIPPAWTDVWICPHDNGHLQATGLDQKNRKQYRYHPVWNNLRNSDKFSRLKQFGLRLPAIRKKVRKDLGRAEFNKEKVLAIVISVMEETCIRVGNECYEKLYGSYGLTTMRDKHVHIDGKKITFRFKGKKGVYHEIGCTRKKLVSLVKKCKEIPGQELFQYYDEKGKRHAVNSEDVNQYMRSCSKGNFTAKDFRTWTGTVYGLKKLLEFGVFETKKACKQNINKAIDEVSHKLGNTRTVCKKYYIHPRVIELYEQGELIKFLMEGKVKEFDKVLTAEENLLLNIIR